MSTSLPTGTSPTRARLFLRVWADSDTEEKARRALERLLGLSELTLHSIERDLVRGTWKGSTEMDVDVSDAASGALAMLVRVKQLMSNMQIVGLRSTTQEIEIEGLASQSDIRSPGIVFADFSIQVGRQ
jgi:hypothetical protein